MNIRKPVYFFLVGLRGQPLGRFYHQYLHEYQTGIPAGTTQRLLAGLLRHCRQNVPYYAKIMRDQPGSFESDPIEYLERFPILTKQDVRRNFEALKSADLPRRRWYYNSTGGSTGEPVRLIQDWEYAARSGAVSLLFSKLAGREAGESEIKIWGSSRDVTRSTESLRARLALGLENTLILNSVSMSRERMREFISILNRRRPKLIVAYVEAAYALAKFAESEGLKVVPQAAVITAAGKLYPFMREKIEAVFGCPVFDRYGSREFGDIACERPGQSGLWAAPWGNYLEIVDSEGRRVPGGVEGEILVTSLTNYAMPLIRYRIGDRGILSPSLPHEEGAGQILQEVTGRSMDLFRSQDGALINPGFFMANLYFRDWINHYQVIQKDYSMVVYKIVKEAEPPAAELAEIAAVTRKALGSDCEVVFEFVETIPPSPSGKFRFLISELS